jgi:hypothetical protein
MQLTEYDLGFRFKKNTFSVLGLIDRYEDKSITLFPDHIYSEPWSTKARSIFIESIIVGMPTTEIWCEESGYGEISVLDGTQRIQCIIDFYNDKFSLTDVKLLPEIEHTYFSDLPYRYKSTFLNRAELYFTIISYDTHPILKFELFKRINSGNRPQVQSARNFAFRDHFKFIRETQEYCSRYLEPYYDSGKLDRKRGYIHAASFDELFLLLSALTLARNSEIGSRYLHEEFLDEAAMAIQFKPDIRQDLTSEIRRHLRRINGLVGRDIIFDVPNLFSRRFPQHYPSDQIKLHSKQISELFILSLRNDLTSRNLQEVIETAYSKSTSRSINHYHRKLFG